MSGLASALRPAFGVAARTGIVIALVLAIVIAWLVGPIQALGRGWLVAFAIWSGVPVGSLVLLMIHRLVGGRWGEALSPVLRPAALFTPAVLLAFLPIAVAMPAVYPWLGAGAEPTSSFTAWYLSEPGFLVRAAVALVGWSVLGIVFGLGRGATLVAALGLAFYGLTISLIAVDWYLSVTPGYVSTAFAAMIAIQQILSALVVAALIGPASLDRGTRGDLAGLMIATVLGVAYLELMIFIIAWYGDQPDTARWYLDRVAGGWFWVLLVTAVIGALLPFGFLLAEGVRRSRSGLRLVGAFLALGITLHLAWLIVPSFETQAGPVLAACAAALCLAIISFVVAGGLKPDPEQGRAADVG